MGKFLRSLKDGTLRCRYCGDSACNCSEDGITRVEIISVDKETEWSLLVHLRRQTLPNGKKIPSGIITFIPRKVIHGVDVVLKTMMIDNSYINKMVFNA